jgi:hypothetical protein
MVPIVALAGQVVIGVVVVSALIILRLLLRSETREARQEEPDEDT